jgi:hypothetical protein
MSESTKTLEELLAPYKNDPVDDPGQPLEPLSPTRIKAYNFLIELIKEYEYDNSQPLMQRVKDKPLVKKESNI